MWKDFVRGGVSGKKVGKANQGEQVEGQRDPESETAEFPSSEVEEERELVWTEKEWPMGGK